MTDGISSKRTKNARGKRIIQLVIGVSAAVGMTGGVLSIVFESWLFFSLFLVGLAFLAYASVWVDRHMVNGIAQEVGA